MAAGFHNLQETFACEGIVEGGLKQQLGGINVVIAADYPILIVTDMEMGFKHSKLPPVSQATLAACNHPKDYRAFAREVVSEAKKAGFNGMWGPVVDVLEGDGPCRVFGNNSFLACGKHYPGGSHGPEDTHMSNAVSYTTKEELLNEALVPYNVDFQCS